MCIVIGLKVDTCFIGKLALNRDLNFFSRQIAHIQKFTKAERKVITKF